MRSTVSDSSGNPENRENPEYGEEKYGAVPVREWVGPEGVGRVTDAWAAAGERADSGGWAVQDEPPGAGGSDAGRPGGSDAGWLGGSDEGWLGAPDVGPGVPVPVPVAGSAEVPGGPVPVSGPDSVVDLVLDLVPGERDREPGGAGFGATSASVSVPASVGAPVAGPAMEARGSVPEPETAHLGPVFRKAAEARTAGPPLLRDAGAHVSALLPTPAPEVCEVIEVIEVPEAHEVHEPPGVHETREVHRAHATHATHEIYATQEVHEVHEVHEDIEVPEPVAAHEPVAVPEPVAAHEVHEVMEVPEPAAVPVEVSAAPEPAAVLVEVSAAPEVSASVPGSGLVAGSGSGPDAATASLPLMFTGEDTGELHTGELRTDAEFRTDARVDTGRHQAVIANERTASIPVHLLFREEHEAGADAAALPAHVVGRAPEGEQPAGVRRAPVPRTSQVRPSTRPAPDADPRLHERPGPSLPGWVAVLTGFGGIAVAGGVLWWTGALPARVLSRIGVGARPYDGLGIGTWAGLALLVTVVLFAFGGLSRGRVGYTWVLTLFGRYRGSVRRTGLMWVSPLLLRRRVDVRLRHWRSEPLPAMDANGTALRVVVLVVWRVKDTVRATLGIEDHEEYLREQVEAAMARVLSQLPADAFHEDAHTLRNAEAVGDALTRMLKADCEPVGVEVYSAQPTGIEYAPEVAAAMQRRRIAAIDAKHRDSVLTSVVDAVDDTVNRLTARGLVELDDYERKSLVKDLTVAFYTGRSGGDSA
ncbi:SPFH domain-containing protein [Streptomyces sp. NBC_00656]|uniref:SPFH domain-containing protein n=1 Tax=Streptomyces sp. NBC_00656 TaxID=2903668 RepID=UPI0032463770